MLHIFYLPRRSDEFRILLALMIQMELQGPSEIRRKIEEKLNVVVNKSNNTNNLGKKLFTTIGNNLNLVNTDSNLKAYETLAAEWIRSSWTDRNGVSLIDREVAGRAAEISLGCGFSSIRSRPQVHTVQIESQDLLFGEFLLQPQGQQSFPDLPGDRAFGRQKEVFRNLLCNCTATLNDRPSPYIRKHSACKASGVYAEMTVEAAVFDGHHSCGQRGW